MFTNIPELMNHSPFLKFLDMLTVTEVVRRLLLTLLLSEEVEVSNATKCNVLVSFLSAQGMRKKTLVINYAYYLSEK